MYQNYLLFCNGSNTFYKLYRFYRSYTLTQRLVSRPGYGGGGSELNEFIASKCDCSEDGEWIGTVVVASDPLCWYLVISRGTSNDMPLSVLSFLWIGGIDDRCDGIGDNSFGGSECSSLFICDGVPLVRERHLQNRKCKELRIGVADNKQIQ